MNSNGAMVGISTVAKTIIININMHLIHTQIKTSLNGHLPITDFLHNGCGHYNCTKFSHNISLQWTVLRITSVMWLSDKFRALHCRAFKTICEESVSMYVDEVLLWK